MPKAPELSFEQMAQSVSPTSHYPPTQPPSHKPPEYRKSQLLRQYTSLLRSTPLMLLWQHNNLRAIEWMSIRRELSVALAKVDAQLSTPENPISYAPAIKLQIVKTNMFKPALKIVHFYKPDALATDPELASSAQMPHARLPPDDPSWTHSLSRNAHTKTFRKKLPQGMETLLTGPVMLTSFPAVSPQHLAAVLSVLSPSKDFPAPKKRTRPSYYDAHVQSGLQKLFLLAARVDGKVFDEAGVKWIGGIEGGLDGLRAQLVGMLTSIGSQLTNTLDSAGRSVYITMEGRRMAMEEEQKGGNGEETSSS
ncbi:hypothetical protein EJ05DRAFT_472573 [Pseudovirgaria hyperparasitica]|uniref:Uncharacterized protein n=1 Tax=Pseudovirgaria hyperparasitica TaxID=470096 RepID=A0A6A6WHX3_9PEZI|nr:uncharacterized protein EJ05DRAFT_472573 [Pseudovirgaria hyperparasitica]KAF2761596.1 hypothetical protein EJ05DRAFT_472573 [Pseudovirgaria hyperparasitica]